MTFNKAELKLRRLQMPTKALLTRAIAKTQIA
jgi:hypothetical protein